MEEYLAMLTGAVLVVAILLAIVVYVYMSFAYMAIGKRANLPTPGLAWIPSIGPAIIAFQASKMHWWPWLILIGFLIPVLNVLASLAFTVVTVVWHWKMFEVLKRPGWWAILMLIPVVNFVIIGIAAWSKN